MKAAGLIPAGFLLVAVGGCSQTETHNHLNAIIIIGVPTFIGWLVDKAKKRDGPGWFVGFLIGVALGTMLLTLGN